MQTTSAPVASSSAGATFCICCPLAYSSHVLIPTLWNHKPPLVVCYLSSLYFNLMLTLNFTGHSVWKPSGTSLLSPFCITGRKSPGIPQRIMDPTTGTNCQTQIPSYLTLAYWLFPNSAKREHSEPLHLLSLMSNPWLWAPTVWSHGFPMKGRQGPWGRSLPCSPFCQLDD